MPTAPLSPPLRRVMMALSGAGFAAALYLFTDAFVQTGAGRWAVPGLAALSIGALSIQTLLALLPWPRALAAGAAHAVLGFGLMALAAESGLAELITLDNSPMLLAAWGIFAILPLPFLRAAHQGQPFSYPALYDASWQIVLLWGMGLLFAALAWATIFGAGELLEVAGLPLVEELMRHGLAVSALTGLMLGLGAAVAAEQPAPRAGFLISALLRLLALPFLVVLVVFLAGLCLRGFSGLSVSLTLLASWSVLLSATLTTAIFGTDIAPPRGILRRTAEALGVLMLPMAGLALWAIALRVSDYGFTPERVGALVLALVACGYALGQAGALLWRARAPLALQRVNVAMALVLIALSAAWLSGLLSPERIATRSQLARHAAGEIALSDLPLRSLARGWGAAGRAGLESLRDTYKNDPEALAVLEALAAPTLPYGLQSAPPPVPAGTPDLETTRFRLLQDQLGRDMMVLPAGGPAAADLAARFAAGPETLQRILDACAFRTPAGHRGCLAVTGEFNTERPGDEVLLLLAGPESSVMGWQPVSGNDQLVLSSTVWNSYDIDTTVAIDQIHSEGVQIRPSPLQLLQLGKASIMLRPGD